MAQVTVILQSTLSDWKTTAQAAINANFTEVYAVTDKIDAATTPNPGDVLTWNTGIGQYEPQAPSSGGINDGDTLSTGLTFPNTGLHLLDTDASHDLIIKPGSNLSADRTLTITTGDSDRTLTLSGNADISGTNTGDQTNITGNAGTATTLQTARLIGGVSFDGSEDIKLSRPLHVQFLSTALADATTYFSAANPKTPNAGAVADKLYIRKAGTINIAEVIFYSVTAGSNENISVYVRVNDTTDYLIATVGAATNERLFTNTSMNGGSGISLSVGDFINIKVVCPTWATNPLQTTMSGTLWLDF